MNIPEKTISRQPDRVRKMFLIWIKLMEQEVDFWEIPDDLDQLRLGTWCLDPMFLRTPEAKAMIPFAQQLVEDAIPPNELQHTYDLTASFRPKT